jgi:hypothetical protein
MPPASDTGQPEAGIDSEHGQYADDTAGRADPVSRSAFRLAMTGR